MIGYVTETELMDYAETRGIVLTLEPSISLTRALDWLELQKWSGSPTDPEQPLAFPRNGSDAVPNAIKRAQVVAAIHIDSGADLFEPIGRAVKQETIGPITTVYMDRAGDTTRYPELDALIGPYLHEAGGAFKVVRV